jgi:pteridine reductase
MTQTEPRPIDGESPVALVTGAGRRVGNALAVELAEQGFRVVLHANRSRDLADATARQLNSKSGSQDTVAIVLSADLRDETATREMIAAARDHFGRIDALVNNAAIWESKPLELTTAANVRRHFEINTLATFVCCQEAGLIMVEQPQGGAIVNVGDWATARPYRDYAAYFAAKGSIPTLTRTFAVELGLRNPRVRVNAILPGPVLLPEAMSEAERRVTIDATLVKREGSTRDVALAVMFLLESTFITGACINVDGGRSIYSPRDD